MPILSTPVPTFLFPLPSSMLLLLTPFLPHSAISSSPTSPLLSLVAQSKPSPLYHPSTISAYLDCYQSLAVQ